MAGWWSRLTSGWRKPEVEVPDAPVAETGDEGWLRGLLGRLGDGDESARAAVRDRELGAALDRLFQAGRERTALDLLARFVAACPTDMGLLARLAEELSDRRDDVAALPVLERLAASPEHGLRARFLLGELHERAGREDAAARAFESILAVDLDYPRARASADRLRRRQERDRAPATAAPTLAGLPEGGTYAGSYRLLRELGRGASGAVYVARDEELQREVAIKILHPHGRAAQRAELRARAWLEARTAASIRHPGVVSIFDLDEERQILVMELCRGGSLRELLAKGPLPPREVLSRAVELLGVLGAVHARGVAHGDVKPANLMLRGLPGAGRGDLALGDFGVARLVGEKPVVDDRCARGTLAYMAPEQRRGDLGPAADVYAAAVLILELASGTAALAPWLGDRGALLRGTARWDGQLPAALTAHLGNPEPLHTLLRAMLSDGDSDRPTASEAAAAISRISNASQR